MVGEEQVILHQPPAARGPVEGDRESDRAYPRQHDGGRRPDDALVGQQ